MEKEIWITPKVEVLDIKKDTFSGSGTAVEHSRGNGPKKAAPGNGPTRGKPRRGR